MVGSLQPTWCVKRKDDTYVPLIAVDELPESVRLIGVPAAMTMEEMVKAEMACKGEQSSHGKSYELEPYECGVSSEASQSSQSSEGSESPCREAFVAPDLKGGQDSAAETKGKGADPEGELQLDPAQVSVTIHPSRPILVH